jgi:preprotein translocase subunit SecY
MRSPGHARTRPTGRHVGVILFVILIVVVAAIAFIVFMERCAAPPAHAVSEAPGRQPHVRGRHLASAAEAQHGRRDPADLRLVAAAAAGDHGLPGSADLPNWAQWLPDRRPAAATAGPCCRAVRRADHVLRFFYTAIVFNPTEVADNLKKHGGFIRAFARASGPPNIIDFVLTRITVIGAVYLTIVCLLPEILISYFKAPFYFGGTSL